MTVADHNGYIILYISTIVIIVIIILYTVTDTPISSGLEFAQYYYYNIYGHVHRI